MIPSLLRGLVSVSERSNEDANQDRDSTHPHIFSVPRRGTKEILSVCSGDTSMAPRCSAENSHIEAESESDLVRLGVRLFM
ncbi:MAG: hypothetical protein CMN02_02335 [Roseibacillus sp.]|nr:hypothetical protein [Roseibacillus sp.]